MNAIPEAVAAIIAGTIREQPDADPEGQARRAVVALLEAGWSITAPEYAPTLPRPA
ncbi:hypothetical protein OOK39_21910 [Streptomyces sp. NBC_00264]|uniref:hypothetical protein n=1 Tax=unclassified Streptomyces TaxID=2593676 RepID=UPI002250F17B|nr:MULTISPECIES: hypothetical protein [unclassified Streptomyces]MCX5161901.1 hypothetical protein [Streptomyces sp. NBC_00305]MCX5220418.1 hypothetical protein [Streptomyces sp. NBC_00264]